MFCRRQKVTQVKGKQPLQGRSFRQHKGAWTIEGHEKARRIAENTYGGARGKNKDVCAESCTCWPPHLLRKVSRETRGSASPRDTSAPCLGLLNRDTEGIEAFCQSETPQPRCTSNGGHGMPKLFHRACSCLPTVLRALFLSLSLSVIVSLLSRLFSMTAYVFVLFHFHAVHTLSIKLIQCEGLISFLHRGSLRCTARCKKKATASPLSSKWHTRALTKRGERAFIENNNTLNCVLHGRSLGLRTHGQCFAF